jgi:hypothetical protein
LRPFIGIFIQNIGPTQNFWANPVTFTLQAPLPSWLAEVVADERKRGCPAAPSPGRRTRHCTRAALTLADGGAPE